MASKMNHGFWKDVEMFNNFDWWPAHQLGKALWHRMARDAYAPKWQQECAGESITRVHEEPPRSTVNLTSERWIWIMPWLHMATNACSFESPVWWIRGLVWLSRWEIWLLGDSAYKSSGNLNLQPKSKRTLTHKYNTAQGRSKRTLNVSCHNNTTWSDKLPWRMASSAETSLIWKNAGIEDDKSVSLIETWETNKRNNTMSTHTKAGPYFLTLVLFWFDILSSVSGSFSFIYLPFPFFPFFGVSFIFLSIAFFSCHGKQVDAVTGQHILVPTWPYKNKGC